MNLAFLWCALFLLPALFGQESVPVVGLVEDEQGSPIENAEIWVVGMQYPQPTEYARSKADRDGRFRVEIPPAATLSPYGGYVVIWARSRVSRLAWQSLNLADLSSEPVRLVAGRRTDTTIQVVGPDGEVVVGAKVRAANVQRGSLQPQQAYAIVPEELSIELAATTNDEGIAKLPDFSAEELAGIRVEFAEFGIQLFSRLNEKARLKKLTLVRAARLVGHLGNGVANETTGTTIDISSVRAEPATGEASEVYSMGYARVTPDESGRFEVTKIAAGRLNFQVHAPKESAVRAQPPTDVVLAADQETQVTIPLKQAIRVRGIVRERGSGKPIARAGVGVISSNTTNETFETNDEGRFEGYVLPGTLTVHVFSPPKPYISPFFGGGQGVEVAESKGEHVFEPIELLRGVSLRGKVVDDKEEPVNRAAVTAEWTMREGSLSMPKSESVRTNERGEFVLEGVDPRGELRLAAAHGDASTIEPTVVRAGGNDPIVLRVSKAATVAATGRVVDRSGSPVAGATVEIWSQSRAPEGHVVSTAIVAFDGTRTLTTDDAGRFETPRQLKRAGEYRVTVRATGMLPANSEWIKLDVAKMPEFPDVILGRLRSLEGRVVDRDGRPVAEASVVQCGDGPQRTQTRTDTHGRFRLDGLHDAPAFVFVEKAGFRFHGQLIDPSQSTAELEIHRMDQPTARSLRTLPNELSREDSLQLARQVLDPFANRVIKEGGDAEKYRTFEVLVRIDAARMLELVEQERNADRADFLKKDIAVQLLADDPDEAIAVVESIRQPYARMFTFSELSDRLPAADRPRKLELLAQALLNARGTTEPAFRLLGLGRVGERLLDIDEVDQATRVLREGAELAKELPQAAYAGFARGAFAEELAQIDLPSALELTKDLSDKYEFERHHGNIAHELAGKNPSEAERVLGIMRDQFQRDQWSPRVCYRMATVDLERARRLAAAIKDPHQRAYAHGVMALAWCGRDKRQAAELLRVAFDQLQQLVVSGSDRWNGWWSSVTVAAALVPVAEQIDPALVPEFMWQAVSFRLPRPQEHQIPGGVEQSDASLALVLARYDRALAQTIFQPSAEKVTTLAKAGGHYRNFGTIFAAAAVIDPHRAVELVEQLPDDPGLEFHTPKNTARITIANTLALRDDDRWPSLAKYLQMWIVDGEDL